MINCEAYKIWRKRNYVHDSPMGPKVRRSAVLTPEEEAICVAFRKSNLLSLDEKEPGLKTHITSCQNYTPNLHRLDFLED
jgi:hypothetical protein